MTAHDPEDPDLVQFISQALELREQGIDPPIEEICRARPELVDAVLETLGMAGRLDSLREHSHRLDEAVGRVLAGRYRLESQIGVGSMGSVYRALDLDLGRKVAVKVLRPQFATGAAPLRRFRREADVLATLKHANIVSVYDRGETNDGLTYFVMELLDGVSLQDLLEDAASRAAEEGVESVVRGTTWLERCFDSKARLESSYVRQAVLWIADLADGLQTAHGEGIGHRDVKPSNIYLRRNGEAVLIDFGLAALENDGTLATRQTALGTPAYMAPETLDRRKDVEGIPVASDVYSLAATLYHLITLRPPYAGTPTQILAEIPRRDPVPAQQVGRGIARDLQAILDRGLARQPSSRYASVAEFADDLRAFLENRPVQARPVSRVARIWRRVRSRAEFRTAVGIALVGTVVYGIAAWRTSVGAELERAWRLELAQVAPSLSFMPKTERRLVNAQIRARAGKELGDLVDVGIHPVPSHMLRALHRLDHGDVSGAAADVRVVADAAGTVYANALAKAYAAVPLGAAGGDAVTLPPTPDLGSMAPVDRYLAGLHAARGTFDPGEAGAESLTLARELLSDSSLQGFPGARELYFLVAGQFSIALPAAEQLREIRRLYEQAIRHEESTGIRTAQTVVMIGHGLVVQGSYAEAERVLLEGIELAPHDLSLRILLGGVQRRLGKLNESRDQAREVLRIAPGSPTRHESLADALVETGEFDEAARVIENAPFASDRGGRVRRAKAAVDVAFSRTLHVLAQGTVDEASPELRSAAAVTLEKLADLERVGGGLAERDVRRRVFCRGVRDQGSRAEAASALAGLLKDDPLEAIYIEHLAGIIPAHLNESQTDSIREFMQSLADALADRR